VEKAFALDRASVALPVAVRVELGARGSLERGMLELHMGDIAQAAEMLGHAHGLAEHNLIRAEQVEGLGGLALVEYVNADLNRASEYVEAARALAEGTTLWTSNYAAPAVVAESLVAIDRHDLGTATRVEPEMLEAARSG